MNFKYLSVLVLLILFINCGKPIKEVKILEVPGKDEFCKVDVGGVSVLPSGRYATPVGESIRITNDPYGMAISPDGKTAITLHGGPFNIINLSTLNTISVPSSDGKIVSPMHDGSFLGVAFSDDSNKVYLSGGDGGAVIVYDINNLKKKIQLVLTE